MCHCSGIGTSPLAAHYNGIEQLCLISGRGLAVSHCRQAYTTNYSADVILEFLWADNVFKVGTSIFTACTTRLSGRCTSLC